MAWWFGAAFSPVWYAAYGALLTVQAPPRVVDLIAPVAPLMQVAGGILALVWIGPAVVLPMMLLWSTLARLRRGRPIEPSGPMGLGLRLGVVLVLLSWAAPFAAQPVWKMRRMGVDACASRAKSVVEALERYRGDAGEYPDSLDNLVPAYLHSVPIPGPIAYPRFKYSRASSTTPYRGYELAVPMLHGGSGDRLIYWPNQAYPQRIYSGEVDVRGTWAYISE
jgi:hypothetical protein